MTEENKEEVSKPEGETESSETFAQTEEKTYTETEKQAIEQGWNPDFEGENKKSASEFIRDGSFFKKIESQKKDINELKSTVKALAEHTKKVQKAAYEQAISELQEQRKKAVQEADSETFDFADNKIKLKEEELKKLESVPVVSNELPQEIKDWAAKNSSWFNDKTKENLRMSNAANALYKDSEQDAIDKGVSKTIAEHLEYVDENLKVMPAFKHHFSNDETSKPNMVGSSTVSKASSTSKLASKLSARQRSTLEMANKSGADMSAEEYAKQLQMIGELRND